MPIQLSPGVNISEIDLTTVIPGVSVSTGGIAGPFVWGPAEFPVTITNEDELRANFGTPNTTAQYSDTFFTAASFLAYSTDLRVVRSANSATYNAFANSNTAFGTSASIQIKNDNEFDSLAPSVNGEYSFVAKYPGALGNGLVVEVFANSNTSLFTSWPYSGNFTKAPGTSWWTNKLNSGANDELHIVVIDSEGKFTGSPGTILEKFESLSKGSNVRDDTGESLYYKDVVSRNSKYIRPHGHPWLGASGTVNNTTWGTEVTSTSADFDQMTTAGGNTRYTLAGGADAALTDGDIEAAYDYFKNKETLDISLLMTASHSATVANYIIENIVDNPAETAGVTGRRDSIVFVSPVKANVISGTDSAKTTKVINDRNGITSSSYAIMDSGWKYMYDKYHDKYIWVPLNGDIAGLCARTDNSKDPWYSPAGLTRGQIKNVVKLAWNPPKTLRDQLYVKDVNPVVTFTGEGTLLYGDKTLLGRPSAFDRINVRRLFIVLEKSISRAARASLFEFNDEFTRSQFVNIVEPFLRNVKSRRGIYDYRVVCDSTNNTPEVIDRNEFVGDIYIKPAKSINFIQLNFVAVRSGVAFEEIVGKF